MHMYTYTDTHACGHSDANMSRELEIGTPDSIRPRPTVSPKVPRRRPVRKLLGLPEYMCMCTHMRVCSVGTHVHVPMCVDTYVNERMPEFWHACAHICNCVHVWMYVCMCAKLLVCVHVRARG